MTSSKRSESMIYNAPLPKEPYEGLLEHKDDRESPKTIDTSSIADVNILFFFFFFFSTR
jgi:hypothetical protein